MRASRVALWAVGLSAGGIVLASVAGLYDEAPRPPVRASYPKIRELAQVLEEQFGAVGLADYLEAVAFWESKGNNLAINPEGGPNAARGWFQIRPETAAPSDPAFAEDPDLLLDPTLSVAAAADLVDRLGRNRVAPDQDPDWLAIRRGWARPILVDDVDELEERSQIVRQNFEESLAAIGVPEAFMYSKIFVPGRSWPGFRGAFEALERAENA